ncbi:hypothetical protein T4C_8118 [Trichinella pseudospiralis]|uniref:Uncharacterized protein n=1 Tax=Trichinella pseudospiralis TaxID=6337 RepID=A0A0V1JGP9_TRIPS|nr:hypothetical protein T4C_8118 [Trichinella pseudospiralis]
MNKTNNNMSVYLRQSSGYDAHTQVGRSASGRRFRSGTLSVAPYGIVAAPVSLQKSPLFCDEYNFLYSGISSTLNQQHINSFALHDYNFSLLLNNFDAITIKRNRYL